MRGGGSPIWTQAAVNMIRVEELILRTVEQPREPAAIHSRHTDDEELLGEERVKVVGGDDVKVDGELGVRPGAELSGVQMRVTGILGAGAEAGDNCNAHRECLCHYEDLSQDLLSGLHPASRSVSGHSQVLERVLYARPGSHASPRWVTRGHVSVTWGTCSS